MGYQRTHGTPPREYPDWMRLVPERFCEVYYEDTENWYYYYNMDWETFLMNGMILHNKDYLVEGGAPEWFTAYLETYEVLPFDYRDNDITLCFYKAGWVKNRLSYHLEDHTTPGGMVYNVSSKIEPDPAFLAGGPPPGNPAVPQSVWEAYAVKHLERLRAGTAWNPAKQAL